MRSERRIALVGAGEHARETLVPILAAMDGLTVSAVVDPDEKAAQRVASRFAQSHVLRDLEHLQASDIDAVVAAAPPAVHESVIRWAVRHGRPAWVEKPPACSLESLEQLVLMAGNSCRVAVDMNFRHAKQTRQLLSWLRSRPDDPPIMLSVECGARWPRGPRWDRGDVVHACMLTHVIHFLDIIVLLAGSVEVQASHIREYGGGIISLESILTSRSGTCRLGFCNAAPAFGFSLNLITAAGRSAIVDGLRSMHLYDTNCDGDRTWLFAERGTLPKLLQDSGHAESLRIFLDQSIDANSDAAHLADLVATYRAMERILANAGRQALSEQRCFEEGTR